MTLRKLQAALAGIGCLLAADALAEAPTVMLLPSGAYQSLDAAGTTTETHTAALDTFFDWETGHALVLAEFLYSNHEKELERFQLGYRVGPATRAWLGRFHAQTSYWNSEFHHGAWLRTAVGTPMLARYEDSGGLMPTHITGLVVDHRITVGDGVVTLVGAGGLGPDYDGVLQPIDLANAHQPARGGVVANIEYQPDITAQTVFGGSIANYEIPSVVTGVDTLYLTPVTLNARWVHDANDILAEVLHLASSTHLPGATSKDSLQCAYVQYARKLPHGFTGYARADFLDADAANAYLALLPPANERELTAGLRYDFLKRFALKTEYVRATPLAGGADTDIVAIEISGVFP